MDFKSGNQDSYVFYCDSEENGVALATPPAVEAPLVCDMSETLFHREIEWQKYSLVLASTYPNVYFNGKVIVIVRTESVRQLFPVPLMADYKLFMKRNSLYQTPATHCIYLTKLFCEAFIESKSELSNNRQHC